MKTDNDLHNNRMKVEPIMIMKRVMFSPPALATAASPQSMLTRISSEKAPTGVAVDAQYDILGADWGNSRIQVRNIFVNNTCDTYYAGL
jgi:hypothetical protein